MESEKPTVNNTEERKKWEAIRKEIREEREKVREKIEEEKEKEEKLKTEMQELLKKVDEQNTELCALSAEIKRIELQQQEEEEEEREENRRFHQIIVTINDIFERLGAPEITAKITDPIEQMELIGEFHRLAIEDAEEDPGEGPSGKRPL